MFSNNITVTTTVTFSVDNHTNAQIIELVSPNENNNNGTGKSFTTVRNAFWNQFTIDDYISNVQFQSSLKRLPPDGECHIPGSFLKNQEIDDRTSDTSESNLMAIQSPLGSNGNPLSFRKNTKMESSSGLFHSTRTSRRSKRKESKHYQVFY